MSKRKHSILPNSIKIQLKDLNNRNLKIENVLCHLNIYISNLSYHTYSFIPTDKTGKVILTKKEIIENTELKHCYDKKLKLDKTPVKFDFFIIDKELLKHQISGIKGYLDITPKSIRADLKRRGFSEVQIEIEIPKSLATQKEDKTLYDFLFQNRNIELKYSEENSKISGYWEEEKDYEYEIKVEGIDVDHMEEFQSYFFVGPEELLNIVEEQYEGSKISQISDIKSWIEKTKQTIVNESVIATFIINEQMELVVSDRHSEHVVCAGGKNVLSAGEITFNFEDKQVYISEISNQSTGYCPKPASWQAVEIALSKINIEHPEYFTRAFEFRYCENCQTKNLIKEDIYECAVCQSDLDSAWNFNKIK